MMRVARLLFAAILFTALFSGLFSGRFWVGVAAGQAGATPVTPATPVNLTAPFVPTPPARSFCRVGVDLYKRLLVEEFDLPALHAGWYVDYYGPSTAHAAEMDYAPVISMRQVGESGYRLDRTWIKIDTLLAANPGAIWLIGNEPDRVLVQDNMVPGAYAAGYHDLYYYIKARDPSAQVVPGNIVQASPLRLQYLDLVLDAYRTRYGEPLPADGWSIHGYLLNERSCAAYPEDCWGAEIPPGMTATEGLVLDVHDAARLDLFAAQIERFRRWMAESGYRDRPFYVAEFGVLLPPSMGYTPETVNRFMRQAFDYMLGAKDAQLGYARDGNRLVQRFAWYGALTPDSNGALYESINASTPISPPFTLSTIGRGYQDYTVALTPTVEIAIAGTALAPARPRVPRDGASVAVAGQATGEFTATLVLTVTNAGNLREGTDVHVSLYDGTADGTGADAGEQLAPAQSVAIGGCGGAQSVQFSWRSPPEGARSGFLTVAVTWNGGSTTQRLAYFVPRHFAFVPVVAR
mgnify:CR=1 FL=1